MASFKTFKTSKVGTATSPLASLSTLSTTPAPLPDMSVSTAWSVLERMQRPGIDQFNDWLSDEETVSKDGVRQLITGPRTPSSPMTKEEFNYVIGLPSNARSALTSITKLPSESATTLLNAIMASELSSEDLASIGAICTKLATHKLERVPILSNPVLKVVNRYISSKVCSTVFDPLEFEPTGFPTLPLSDTHDIVTIKGVPVKVLRAGVPATIHSDKVSFVVDPESKTPTLKVEAEDDEETIRNHIAKDDEDLQSKIFYSMAYVATKTKKLPPIFDLMTSEASWFKTEFEKLVKLAESHPFKLCEANPLYVLPMGFKENYAKFRLYVQEFFAGLSNDADAIPPMSLGDLESHRSYRNQLKDDFKDIRDPTGNIRNESVSVNNKWSTAILDAVNLFEHEDGASYAIFAVGHSTENRWQHTLEKFKSKKFVVLAYEGDVTKTPFVEAINKFAEENQDRVKLFISDVFDESAGDGFRNRLIAQSVIHSAYKDARILDLFDAAIVKFHPSVTQGTSNLIYGNFIYYMPVEEGPVTQFMAAGAGFTRMHNMEILVLLTRNKEVAESPRLSPIDADTIGAFSTWCACRGNFHNLLRNTLLATGLPFVNPENFFIGMDENYVLPPLEVSADLVSQATRTFKDAMSITAPATLSQMSNVLDLNQLLKETQLVKEKQTEKAAKEAKLKKHDPKIIRQAKVANKAKGSAPITPNIGTALKVLDKKKKT